MQLSTRHHPGKAAFKRKELSCMQLSLGEMSLRLFLPFVLIIKILYVYSRNFRI